MSAIDAVRNGMSALQAARKFGVPSRTLYDKVKKMNITTSRPFRRSNGSNGAAFPYAVRGAGGNVMFGISGEEESGQSAMLEHGLLQHALEIGGKIKTENTEREAMSSTPPATMGLTSQGFLQRALEIEERVKTEIIDKEAISMAQGNISGTLSSPPAPNDRSPSPNLIKYAQRSRSLTPSPPMQPPEDNYEDQVEDLSMSRKPEQQSRVIMPPMNQTTATMLATCSDSRRD